MMQVEHPPQHQLQHQHQHQHQHEDVVMATAMMSQPATPRPRKWVKRWMPQDTILNSGKLMLQKWVTEDMVTQFSGVAAPHAEEQEVEENEILYLCTFEGCGKGFPDAGSLRKHAHTHGEKQFICHYEGCGKRFVDSSKLKRHFLIHTGEKHFVCPFEGCGKAFSLDFNLRSHMRTHTGENYHACPYEDCGKRYAHEYKLRAHMRNHHDKSIPEMSPPPMHMERERERERDQELEMGRYREMDREREREIERERERERENVIIPKAKSGPPRQDLNASDRPFACPHPGCTKRYIHEYKLNLHLRSSHPDENLEYEGTPVGRGDSDGEDDIDEGSMQGNTARGSASKGSGKGKLKIIPKRAAVEPKRKKGKKVQPEVDLNLRMRLPSEPSYWGGGQVKQTAPAHDDSEETEEDDAENTEDEGYKYYQGRGGERSLVDDEDTEDDGDQY
ncbi:hypothetical protein M758_3G166100 [Ceratodon purpureus]|nr:hypothetical protein M758_3G166100 [Ceratodon purpureus]